MVQFLYGFEGEISNSATKWPDTIYYVPLMKLQSFFFDQTGRFFGQRRRSFETRFFSQNS
jgi:hypothetical protein